MAKGKHAAAAARKRLHDAEERIKELEHLREGESAEAHAREEELKKQVARLEGRLVSEVQALAQERVDAAEQAHWREMERLKREHRDAVRDAFQLIEQSEGGGLRLTFDEHTELAEILGVEVGEFLGWTAANASRQTKRSTNRRAKHISTLIKQGRLP